MPPSFQLHTTISVFIVLRVWVIPISIDCSSCSHVAELSLVMFLSRYFLSMPFHRSRHDLYKKNCNNGAIAGLHDKFVKQVQLYRLRIQILCQARSGQRFAYSPAYPDSA